ncbi:MAG: S8 family peptidase [Candidatus Sericytochromatia bacterium]|nr:S8 family peptidase [Candidatus Sericytochromatia bacterium]
MSRRTSLFLLALATTACEAPAAPAPRSSQGLTPQAVRTERLVIGFADARSRQAALADAPWPVLAALPELQAVVVVAPGTARVRAALAGRRGVRYVEADQTLRLPGDEVPAPALRTGDEQRDAQWALDRIGIDAAWAVTTGSPRVRVAVVDTGIDASHPDLRGRVLPGRDVVNGDDDATDDNFHGTHCAGIVAAGRGNGGVVGVAPGVSLLPVKVLDAKGSGTLSQVAAGLVWAADQRPAVISLSLGTDQPSQLLADAVRHAQARGALLVAGTGNKGHDKPFYPAVLPGVLAVGATGKDDVRASFSNYGPHVALTAPGRDILSTIPDGKWARMSGTSMATPHVAGVAALLASLRPGLTAAGLRARLEATAVDLGPPGRDDDHGAGRLDAGRALTGLVY